MTDKDIWELAKEAGFVFWEDESWNYDDAIIDWSSNYDTELLTFARMIEEKCRND